MIETTAPENTQPASFSDAALSASADVLSAAGYSVADLFSPGDNYESALKALQANGVDSEEATTMVAFAQGLATKNEAAIGAFSTALSRYQVAQSKESAQYNEVSEMYESDENVRIDANRLADLLSELYGKVFSGDNVLGGVSMSTGFFSTGEGSSKKRYKSLLLLGLMLTACSAQVQTGQETQTPTPIITELAHSGLDNAWSTLPLRDQSGTEYYVQNDQELLAKDLKGYTAGDDGEIMETAGSFALYLANLESIDGTLADQKVALLKEKLADGSTGLELLLLVDPTLEEETVFSLFDKHGVDTGFKILLLDNQTVILRITGKFDGENVRTVDYVLANDQVDPNMTPTTVPTQSPDMLIQLFTKIIELDPGLESAAAAPQSTETPAPTSTPDSLAGAPEGYTSFDEAMGMWSRIDAESGKTIYWDAERNAEYSLMFDDDLWDRRPDLESQLPDSLRLRVFIDPRFENWNKLTVTHQENMSKQGDIDWTVFFQNTLWTKMMFAGLIADKLDFSNDQFYNGEGYTKNYNTSDGPQKLTLKAGNISSVYVRSDYEALLADSENNGFTQAIGGDLGGVTIKYMIRITSDADGNTITEIAPSISDILSIPDVRHIEMYLFGFSNALCNPDDPMVPRATSLSSELAKNHSTYQYFIFTRSK